MTHKNPVTAGSLHSPDVAIEHNNKASSSTRRRFRLPAVNLKNIYSVTGNTFETIIIF